MRNLKPLAIRTVLALIIVLAAIVVPRDNALAFWRGTKTRLYGYTEVKIMVNHHDLTSRCQALIRFTALGGSFNVTVRTLQLRRDGQIVAQRTDLHNTGISTTISYSSPRDGWYYGGNGNYSTYAIFDIRDPSGLKQNLVLESYVDINHSR